MGRGHDEGGGLGADEAEAGDGELVGGAGLGDDDDMDGAGRDDGGGGGVEEGEHGGDLLEAAAQGHVEHLKVVGELLAVVEDVGADLGGGLDVGAQH